MIRLFLALAAAVALHGTVVGQSFEVASIKTAQPSTDGRLHVWRNVDDARLSYMNVSFRDMLKEAFHIQDDQIAGPDWLGSERFDITAKISADTRKNIPEMLQALLVERFGLMLHWDTKEMAHYSLEVSKAGSRLQKVDSPTGLTSNTGRACNHVNGELAMTALTDFLSQQLQRPVVDKTGMEGAYRVGLEWTADASATDAASCGPSLVTAVQEQLGLSLSSQKGPVRIAVIDQLQRTPTAN